jgi:hypothetical protein
VVDSVGGRWGVVDSVGGRWRVVDSVGGRWRVVDSVEDVWRAWRCVDIYGMHIRTYDAILTVTIDSSYLNTFTTFKDHETRLTASKAPVTTIYISIFIYSDHTTDTMSL